MPLNFDGLLIGAASFLIIGLFHPLVIKTEYYFGTRPWWIFLVLGVILAISSLLIESTLISTVLGIIAFCLFWTIQELFEQEERVKKGWFPKNPKRKYPAKKSK